MRDGPTLSGADPAEEPGSVIEAVTDCPPQAFVDCLLDSALEPVLDAAVQRGRQAAKRKKNSGEAAEIAKALLAAGAKPGARDSKGETPLKRALNCKKRAVAELLATAG